MDKAVQKPSNKDQLFVQHTTHKLHYLHLPRQLSE